MNEHTALHSRAGTQAFFNELVQAQALSSKQDIADIKIRFANEHHWHDSKGLEQFSRDSGVLVDRNTVRFERRLKTQVTHAWQLISEPVHLAIWYIPTTMDFRVGGRFDFHNAWQGQIGVLDEEHEIRFDADKGGRTLFQVKQQDDYTLFTLEDFMAPELVAPAHVRLDGKSVADHQQGGPGTHWYGVLTGWHCFADALRSIAEGITPNSDDGALEDLYRRLLVAYFEI